MQANIVSAARKLGRYPEVDDLAPMNLIYSIGLMDYLEDKIFIQVRGGKECYCLRQDACIVLIVILT